MRAGTLHPSIRTNENLANYISDECKYYYLPLFEETLFDSRLSRTLGAKNFEERKYSGIRTSLVKARKAHYSHIKIPFDGVDNEKIKWTITRAEELNLGIVLQICVSFLFDDEFFLGLKKLSSSLEIEWVLDSSHEKVVSRVSEVSQSFKETHVSVVVHKNLNWKGLSRFFLSQSVQRVHLYFSYQLDPREPNLNCKESHKVVGLLRKKFPKISFLPPKGVDLWDHRALPDFDMEPYCLPCFQTSSRNPTIKYSIVIPTFNNQNHLRVVLRHLYQQDVGLDNFEVVVVDDGGTDQTQLLVLELLKSFPDEMNFKYIFFQRPRKRVMGDSQYRAGISRNLGVKNSEGEILCFLDSDIIVANDYLKKVDLALQSFDAVQAKRINLSQTASSLHFSYASVDEKKDCVADEPYWEDFLKSKDWHQMPYNWKYVCTHSFSIRKDLFWKLGGLKKNFIYYGFEDTDLGFRLVKRGYKLHLLDEKVYHMFHENTRSEFMNLKSLRHSLLSRTAQIFYLHHLDEDIYENLLGFMEPEPTFRRLLSRTMETLSLQFLWRPSPMVYKSISRVKRSEK